MKCRRILLLILLLPVCMMGQESLSTFFEESGGTRTPRYDETISYCQKLDEASSLITYTTFGKSPQGRVLPLLIVDRDGYSDMEKVKNSGRLVLMIQACIHSGESDGKDAGFLLLRDMILKPEYKKLLDKVSILFIPILNVDGHERFGRYNRINQNGPEEMGWRTTAHNLNLNRDYMKADAPEMQAWLKLFNTWLPGFFVDCHVTDGADYPYVITYALETLGNMEEGLTDWTKKVCEPWLVSNMETAGFPVFPYVMFRNWHDPRSGLVSWAAPPMLSQGYAAVQNRPGLLIESHMMKPYKQRVEANHEMLRLLLILLNRESSVLLKLEKAADEYTSASEFRRNSFPVSWSRGGGDSVMREFRGFDYTIDTSDLTGGLWFRYDRNKPVTWMLPSFESSKPEAAVILPEAYIVPVEWSQLADRLQLHGVEMKQLTSAVTLPVSVLSFADVKWQPRSYEGRHKVNFSLTDTIREMTFPAGSWVVDMNQRRARVIAHLLEPKSPDSFASWGFLDAVMEQKEYTESYVMETEARKMLAADPALKQEFEAKMNSDKAFASDPDDILNWFYSRSPWWDSRFNVYPVGRVLDRSLIEKIR